MCSTGQIVSISSTFFVDNLSRAALISIVGYIEAISVAKKFAAMNNYYIRTNQEMFGLAINNLISGCFHAYPVTGSLTRTAVQYHAGAKTPAASFFSATVVGVVLVALTQTLFYCPQACLAAIVVLGAYNLIDVEVPAFLWKYDKTDFLQWLFTVMVTIFVGVDTGIVFGIGTTLLQVIVRSSQPRCVILGRLPDRDAYRDITRFPHAKTTPGVLIVRFDARLAFYNIQYFLACLENFEQEAAKMGETYHALIIDCEGINDVDSTALYSLKIMFSKYEKKRMRVLWALVKQGMRDAVEKADMADQLGGYWMSIKEAVDFAVISMPRADHAAMAEVELTVAEAAGTVASLDAPICDAGGGTSETTITRRTNNVATVEGLRRSNSLSGACNSSTSAC
jgi:SulP family sulfate permease